jgi:penicillin amidase/acyl-homoserine-lactone acylase
LASFGCASLPASEPVRLEPWLEAAARRDVRILRDEFGVPHIYGKTDPDVSFGLAYAHSEDDFETIQKVLLQTRGHLAAVDGAAAAPFDYLVHVLGFWADVEARYESDIPEPVRAIAEAYAEGVNLYAAENPRAVLPGWYPARGQDLVAGFVFRTPFFYGMERTLIELLAEERQREISAPPGEHSVRPFPALPVRMGSNAVAVAPSRSADGATRLLVNSHQPYTGPVAWYEARLKSEEGWDMIGGVFPGSPLILHGTGRNLGWANTVNFPDLADVYVLEIHPDDQDLYRYDGKWLRLERSEVTLPVHLFGPFRIGAKREILRSVHGPVLRTTHGTYALRYVGMNEVRQLEQYYRLNRATNYEEWHSALSMQALPSINYVYADREGRVAYFYNVKSPVRAPGWDWGEYLPGDRSDLVWNSFHPLARVPQVVAPASGFVANANHTPFRATVGVENPSEADFPDWGIETQMTNRGLRLLEQFGEDESITAEEFRAYKYDKRYSVDSEAQRITAEVLAFDFADDAEMKTAQAHLANWDFSLEIDDRAAALGVITATSVVVAALSGQDGPSVEQAFRDAVQSLQEHHGGIDVAWGEVNRFQRGDLDLPIAGGPDVLRAVESFVLREDGRYVSNSGDCYILFTEWAADGTQTVETIHQFGTATLDEDSPHYADQVPLFIAEKARRARLDLEELLPHVTSETRPGR